MKEKTLRAFFDGGTDAQALDREAVESMWRPEVASYWIEDMSEDMGDFEVTREMVLKLCDAFLSGALGPRGLQAVGFMMEASNWFHWDDPTIAEVVRGWGLPEINWAITEESVARSRELLVQE